MLGDDHLHIEKDDPIADWLAGSMRAEYRYNQDSH